MLDMKVIWKVWPLVAVVAVVVLGIVFSIWRINAAGEYDDIWATNRSLAEVSFPVPKDTLLVATDGERCRTELWSTAALPNPYLARTYDAMYRFNDVRVIVYTRRPDDPKIRRVIEDGVIYDYLRDGSGTDDTGTVERLVSEEVIPIPDQYIRTSGDPQHQWTFRVTPPDSSTFEWREDPTQVARL